MINKRIFKTFDKVEVSMSSLHVLDFWEEHLELNPDFIDSAYQETLPSILRRVRSCFTEELPILQLPFIVKTKNKPKCYPQWLVVFSVEGAGARLVVTKMVKSIEGILFEKELFEILEKVDWKVHAEEVL